MKKEMEVESQILIRIFFIVALCLLASLNAKAQNSGGQPPDFEKFKAAADTCASQLGIDSNMLGPNSTLSSDQKTKFDKCLSDEGFSKPPFSPSGNTGSSSNGGDFRQAADACAKQNGIDPNSLGKQPLTDDIKAKMETCLSGKGFNRPPLPTEAPPQGEVSSTK